MPFGAAGRVAVLCTLVSASGCIRDDWTYTARRAGADASSSDIATDLASAADSGTADIGPTDTGPTDIGPTDIGPTDTGPTDTGPTDTGPTDTGPTDAGPADAGPADAGPTCPTGMALIPAGQFLMGDPMGADAIALPVHGVRMPASCMDVAEVTVAAYRACTATGCTPPGTMAGCNWSVGGRDNHPINCVTADQARAYCRTRGGDLPTEAQWEFAARGVDGRVYPWGSTTPGSQLCWSVGSTRSGTCPVGSFPAGATANGLQDMAGNIWEWTADWFYGYTGDAGSYVTNPVGPEFGSSRTIRGGNWHSTDLNEARATFRAVVDVPFSIGVGFRCVRVLP